MSVDPDKVPSKKEIEALRAFARLKKRLSRTPTLLEIAEELGSGNKTTPLPHLKSLEKKGLLTEPQRVKIQDVTEEGQKWL